MAVRKTSPVDGHESDAACAATGLVDAMLSRYITWREDAAAVTDAYRQWCEASVAESASRFSAYLAALDREESSARGYAVGVADVERSLHHARSA